MMEEIIAFGASRSFALGLFIGACCGGGAFGIIGWCVGYDRAMTKVGEWMRPKNRDADHFGDMPTLPPARDRRFLGDTR